MTTEGEREPYGRLIEAIAGDCAANRREIVAGNKRLDNMNLVLSNLSFQAGGQQQQLVIMGNDVTDTKDVVESMNLRVIKIEAEASETNTRLNRMEAALITHGDKLAAILDAVQRPGGRPGTKTVEN